MTPEMWDKIQKSEREGEYMDMISATIAACVDLIYAGEKDMACDKIIKLFDRLHRELD